MSAEWLQTDFRCSIHKNQPGADLYSSLRDQGDRTNDCRTLIRDGSRNRFVAGAMGDAITSRQY